MVNSSEGIHNINLFSPSRISNGRGVVTIPLQRWVNLSEGIHNNESTKACTKLWKLFPCTHTPGYQPFTSPDWSVAGCVLDRGKVRPSDPRVFHHDTGTMSNLPAFIKEIVRGDGNLVARRIIIEWRQLMTRCHSFRFGLKCVDGYILQGDCLFTVFSCSFIKNVCLWLFFHHFSSIRNDFFQGEPPQPLRGERTNLLSPQRKAMFPQVSVCPQGFPSWGETPFWTETLR